jgi:geranylgeranyl pyrophosphate synthase
MSGFLWGDEALDADLDRVREYLSGEAERAEDFVGPDIAAIIGREGKLFRPALAILSGRLGPCSETKLISLAAAIEMIHLGVCRTEVYFRIQPVPE